MLTTFINGLMSTEADVICGTPDGQSIPERTIVRNGYRHREFDTRAGRLDVAVGEAARGQLHPGSAGLGCGVKQSGAMLPVLRKGPLAIIPATGGRHQRRGRRGRRRRRRSATLSAARAPFPFFGICVDATGKRI
jgi:hypothetical protein